MKYINTLSDDYKPYCNLVYIDRNASCTLSFICVLPHETLIKLRDIDRWALFNVELHFSVYVV